MALQTSHIPLTVLLQDGRKIRLGYVVHERAIAENQSAVARQRELFVPLEETEGQRLYVDTGDLCVDLAINTPAECGVNKGAGLTFGV